MAAVVVRTALQLVNKKGKAGATRRKRASPSLYVHDNPPRTSLACLPSPRPRPRHPPGSLPHTPTPRQAAPTFGLPSGLAPTDRRTTTGYLQGLGLTALPRPSLGQRSAFGPRPRPRADAGPGFPPPAAQPAGRATRGPPLPHSRACVLPRSLGREKGRT